MSRYTSELKNTYSLFVQCRKGSGKKVSSLLFADVLYKRFKYRISVNDYFDNKLYDKTVSHKDYLNNTAVIRKRWKTQHRLFRPDEGKLLECLHFIDYCAAKAYCRGLNARDYFMYEFYKQSISDRRDFITDGYLSKMNYHFNGGSSPEITASRNIMDDKSLFNQYFAEFVGREWIYMKTAGYEEFSSMCSHFDKVIVKPLQGVGGAGIVTAEVKSLSDIRRLYDELHGKNYLVEEILTNQEDIRRINPSSLNTIRVCTVCKDGEFHVTGAALRMGQKGSSTDNFSSGGLAAEIDCNTGTVCTRAVGWQRGSYYVHPDSGQKIIGFKIPDWDKVCDLAIKAHQRISNLRYIGWDIAVCPDNKLCLIEANVHAGVDLQQYPSLKGKKHIYKELW